MKIVSVEVEKRDVPGHKPPFRWRAGLPGSDPGVLGAALRIGTDDGLVGVALSSRGVILVGDEMDLMYDGSAGFDLPDAVYLGHALADAGYFWYEEPMREFSITAYKWLAERARVPLLVGETSDGAHMNMADFIASGCATFVRPGTHHKGGITGAMRIAHTADSFRLRAEVAGGGPVNIHLCMAIPNTTYYESLVTSNPVVREPLVDARGMVHAPSAPGIGYPEERKQLRP
jgi:L-alanine-DL-glutamate epimerase-like enolase superfamily enzyme